MHKYLVISVLILFLVLSFNSKDIYRLVIYNLLVENDAEWIEYPPRAQYDYDDQFIKSEPDFSFCIDSPLECRRYLKALLSGGGGKETLSCDTLYVPKFGKYDSICGPNGSILFTVSTELDCAKPVVMFLHGRDSEPRVLHRQNDMDYHNGILNLLEERGVQYIAPLINSYSSYFERSLFKGSVQIDLENSLYLANELCPKFSDLTIAGMSYGAYLSELIYVGFNSYLKPSRLISIGGMMRRRPHGKELFMVNDSPSPRELIYSGVFDVFFACGNVLFINGDYDKTPTDVLQNVKNLQLTQSENCPKSGLEFAIFNGFHEVPREILASYLEVE
jgi:hypothetical protein